MFKSAESFSTTLSGSITPAATSISLPPSAIAFLTALGINGTNYTEVAVSDGISFEIMRLNQVVGSAVTITRAQAGTVASSFPNGTPVRFVWTANGIQEEAVIVGASVSFTSNIAGAITGGPAVFNMNFPVYSAGTNLVLTGTYPNFTIGLDPGFVPPASGTVTNVSSSGDFNITDPTTTPVISLSSIFPTPAGGNVFGGGLSAAGAISGIRVSNTGRVMEVATQSLPNGTYSYAEITVTNGVITGVTGGTPPSAFAPTGTVTIVNAGTGITVSGVPTDNPTISLSNTGVVAGVYGGVQINAQGQIVAVPGGFSPISSITSASPGIVLASGGTGIVSITINQGTDTIPGLVEYADNAELIALAATNRAVTPAGLKTVINNAGRTVKEVVVAGSSSGPALTTVVQTAVVANAADYVLVTATGVLSDPAAGPSEYAQTFALGIYVNGVAHTVLPAYASGHKTITALVSGFIGGNIELRITTPTGTQVASGMLTCAAITDIP